MLLLKAHCIALLVNLICDVANRGGTVRSHYFRPIKQLCNDGNLTPQRFSLIPIIMMLSQVEEDEVEEELEAIEAAANNKGGPLFRHVLEIARTCMACWSQQAHVPSCLKPRTQPDTPRA